MPFLCVRVIPSLSGQDQLLFPASAGRRGDVAGRRGEHWGDWGGGRRQRRMGAWARPLRSLPCRSITGADSSYGEWENSLEGVTAAEGPTEMQL